MPQAGLAYREESKKTVDLPPFLKPAPITEREDLVEKRRRATVNGAAMLGDPIEAIPFDLRWDERLRYHCLVTYHRLHDWLRYARSQWLGR